MTSPPGREDMVTTQVVRFTVGFFLHFISTLNLEPQFFYNIYRGPSTKQKGRFE